MAPVPTPITFGYLLTRAAETLHVADYTSGAAGVPTDPHDLDLCTNVVHTALRDFLSRRDWIFMRPRATLTLDPTGATCVDGDPAVMKMPAWFTGEHEEARWLYPPEGPFACIEQRELPELLVNRQTFGPSTGDPRYFAYFLPNSDAPTNQGLEPWQIMFWPTPGTARTIESRIRRYPTMPQHVDEVLYSGPEHDAAVIALVKAHARAEKMGGSAANDADAEAAIVRSLEADARARSRKLGPTTFPMALAPSLRDDRRRAVTITAYGTQIHP